MCVEKTNCNAFDGIFLPGLVMKKQIEWQSGKGLQMECDSAQVLQLSSEKPLYVVLELYFSCLIRKRVLCSGEAFPGLEYIEAGDNIFVAFRPVMTRACRLEDSDGPPELTDFPIKRPNAYLPRWVRLWFASGQWQGEFGY